MRGKKALSAVLAHATRVFGNRERAEEWLRRPAFGLAHRIPLELLSTPAGARQVTVYLKRIEYGVYC